MHRRHRLPRAAAIAITGALASAAAAAAPDDAEPTPECAPQFDDAAGDQGVYEPFGSDAGAGLGQPAGYDLRTITWHTERTDRRGRVSHALVVDVVVDDLDALTTSELGYYLNIGFRHEGRHFAVTMSRIDAAIDVGASLLAYDSDEAGTSVRLPSRFLDDDTIRIGLPESATVDADPAGAPLEPGTTIELLRDDAYLGIGKAFTLHHGDVAHATCDYLVGEEYPQWGDDPGGAERTRVAQR